MVFSFLKKFDFTNKQFHFLVHDRERKIRSECGGFMSCLQILLSLAAFINTFCIFICQKHNNLSLSVIDYDSSNLSQFDLWDNITFNLLTPNELEKEKEIFYKYFRIVQKIITIKEGVIYENVTILKENNHSNYLFELKKNTSPQKILNILLLKFLLVKIWTLKNKIFKI